MVGRNLKTGCDGCCGSQDRARRIAVSRSDAGGGQEGVGVVVGEVAGSFVWALGKGERMLAAATPFDERGSVNGSLSVWALLGVGRQSGGGGKGSSKPEGVQDSSGAGCAKCDMSNVPIRSEVAAQEVSLFMGLIM